MAAYKTIAARAEAEIVEKKSHFIGQIAPVATEEEALAFIAEVKAAHRMARHNVYAYVLRGGRVRYTDDGEPAKTAGMPTLEAIQHAGLEDVAVVVTRYFGGVLLGAGGLVRAYTQSAKDALDAAGISVVRRWVELSLPCAYGLFERMKLEVERQGGALGGVEYAEDVTIRALLPEQRVEDFIAAVTERTAGEVLPRACGEAYRAVPIK